MTQLHNHPLLLQAASALYRLAGATPNLSRSTPPGTAAPDNTTAQLIYNSRDVNVPFISTIANQNSSVTLWGANPSRRYIFVQNVSPYDIWVNFDVPPYALSAPGVLPTRSSGSIIIPAGGSWEPESPPADSGFAVCSASNPSPGTQCLIVVLEGLYD